MDLWVERYRPNSLDGYVFKNDDVKAQVEQWLKDGYAPGHMLFSGPQGTGKCLVGTEMIEIEVDESKLTEKQKEIINKY